MGYEYTGSDPRPQQNLSGWAGSRTSAGAEGQAHLASLWVCEDEA